MDEAKITVITNVASSSMPLEVSALAPNVAKAIATLACGIKPKPKYFLVSFGCLVANEPKNEPPNLPINLATKKPRTITINGTTVNELDLPKLEKSKFIPPLTKNTNIIGGMK